MYLSYARLIQLFTALYKTGTVKRVLICETISADFSFDSNLVTRFDGARRQQMCFSHDYRKLLSGTGFSVRSVSYAPVWIDNRWGRSNVREDVVAVLVEAQG